MHGLPKSEGALFTQNFVDLLQIWGIQYSDTSVPFNTGGIGSVKERCLRHFLDKEWNRLFFKPPEAERQHFYCVCLGSNVGYYFLPLTKTLTSRQMLYSHKSCVSASLSHRYANTKKCLTPVQAKTVNSFSLVEHQQLHLTYKGTLLVTFLWDWGYSF